MNTVAMISVENSLAVCMYISFGLQTYIHFLDVHPFSRRTSIFSTYIHFLDVHPFSFLRLILLISKKIVACVLNYVNYMDTNFCGGKKSARAEERREKGSCQASSLPAAGRRIPSLYSM